MPAADVRYAPRRGRAAAVGRTGQGARLPAGLRAVLRATILAAALLAADPATGVRLLPAVRPAGAFGTAVAMELCSPESLELMRSVGISDAQIRTLCAKAAQQRHRLSLALVRAEDAMGYCRVRLELANHATQTVDSLVLTVDKARFEPFRFTNIPPGGTGYASSNSRILLACDELRTVKLVFHWPPSLRIAGRVLSGRQLLYYRPHLLDPALAWSH